MGQGTPSGPLLFALSLGLSSLLLVCSLELRTPEFELLGLPENPGALSWAKQVTMFPSCLENLQGDVCSMKGVGLIRVWKLHFTSGSRRVFVRI